jgi:hypothetical protein
MSNLRSNLEISHSRISNLKRIRRVVFCISKGYEAAVEARLREFNFVS